MNLSFWKGKKVLITGHTGFKGSWLSLWLQNLGADVFGYSLEPPTEPNLFKVADVGGRMTSQNGDVRNLEHLKAFILQNKPEIIIHMAAQSLVRYSYDNPIETYQTNVMGTANLLEAVRSAESVRVVVNVTTDKCYENREWVWGYRENDPMGGYDPYSSSKGCSELVTAAYSRSFLNPENYQDHGVAVASARAGNVIGGGDWAADRLIPDCMKSLMKKESIVIRYPKAIRPWQHVLEPLSGYLLLAERLYIDGPAFSGAWNFGPRDDDAKPVDWIAKRITASWGDSAGWEKAEGDNPHEANYLKLDCSKAKSKLGWLPRWDLSSAIEKTVVWYKAYSNGEDILRTTIDQIQSYEDSR